MTRAEGYSPLMNHLYAAYQTNSNIHISDMMDNTPLHVTLSVTLMILMLQYTEISIPHVVMAVMLNTQGKS